jgi:hypothetical protein
MFEVRSRVMPAGHATGVVDRRERAEGTWSRPRIRAESSLGAATAVGGHRPEHPPEESSVGRPHDAGITKVSADETVSRAQERGTAGASRQVNTGPPWRHATGVVYVILSMKT